MTLSRILTLFFVALFLVHCAKPVPPEKADYIGLWSGPGMSLAISQDGKVEYHRVKGDSTTTANVPIKAFAGDHLEIGISIFSTRLEVSRQPYREGAVWKMVVDGVELTRPAPEAAAEIAAAPPEFPVTTETIDIEAEDFAARDGSGGMMWKVVPTEDPGAGPAVRNPRGGKYIQCLPDATDLQHGASVSYKVEVKTSGTYRLYIRVDGNNSSDDTRTKSDSIFARIVELKDGEKGAIADHYEFTYWPDGDFETPVAWLGDGGPEENQATASALPTTWALNAGSYTLMLEKREDGAVVDSMRLQLVQPASAAAAVESAAPAPAAAAPAAPAVVPPAPVPSGEPVFRTNKSIYASGESITVEFSGLPGNEQDWITVVKATAAENSYEEWYYLQRKRDGTMAFRNPGPGTYEARLYYDWPRGSYQIQKRAGFVVQ